MGDLEVGMQALEAGDWTAARAAFEAVLAGGESPAARMGLGDALAWLGDTEAAVQAWQRAYGDFRRERAAERAAVAAISLAITYQASLGNDDAARGWLARLVRDIEPLRGWELVIRSGLEYDDAQAAHAFSREALEIAARHGDRDLELCALCEAGAALTRMGRIEEGLALLGEAMAVDITPALLEIARERTPEADLRLGDLQALPWPDASFDVVAGFNAFFYAEDVGAALREAHRVLRPGGRLAMTAFGRPHDGDFTPVFELIADALPAMALEADDGPPFETLLADAGFEVELAEYRRITDHWDDLESGIRAYLSAGPLRAAVRELGEDRVAGFMRETFTPLVGADGHVRITDEYRLLTARRPARP